MGEPLQIDVLTVFPGMLRGFLEESMLRRAARQGAVVFRTVDLRDFARDARRTADDRPYGGGPGMIMKPELWFEAIEAVRTPGARVILMTPSGETFRQAEARRLAKARHLIFVCGHYEGIDDRVRAALVTDELSIGDYVLTNGVLPAAVVVDAVVRLLPGVLGGGEAATRDESFSEDRLEYPQYTRPPVYRGMAVPAVLQNGNHAEVEAWRERQALDRTAKRRPDLLVR
ncbi:MAG TPA: tRNA (guanosine(37)-N1)-methyltransferase TrmD [Kiritimatiellia bacterium]|jgi:tRNA (guanine37-N1)-methyltransferase|nr:tRNA (guanosine(37)-N1)-methyltransferase TrmD [Kiritimatiellia bacterium]HQL51682.1 tRNA (guanosine(37)-N1)-methyltransferase TrmD [Kiritimatiellia bacterium]